MAKYFNRHSTTVFDKVSKNAQAAAQMPGNGQKSPSSSEDLPDALTAEQIASLDPSLFAKHTFDVKGAERSGYSGYSYWGSTLKSFWRNRVARILIITLAIVLVFTFIQPLLPAQKSPTLIHNDAAGMHLRNNRPSSDFWFGTNSLGQDLWARVWSGTRTSLLIGFIVSFSNYIVGMIVGMVWGYMRKFDRIFTEIYNIIDNIPHTIILILISYILRPSLSTIIISMCLVGWLSMARFIRNQVMIIRDRDFNLASRCLGTPPLRIVLKNLLPQMVSVIMLQTALAIPGAIGDEVFLTYIGLGLPASIPSLGNLVETGRILIMSPSLNYQLFFPAAVISFITIAFYIVGNAFADASDPKNHT